MKLLTLLGLTAALCTTISFFPQAIKVIRTRHTKDLSLSMYAIFTIGVFLWMVYGIFLEDIPLIFSNAITFVLSAIILLMKIKHK